MRLRIKFSKNGLVKYVSHLDVMRYFQKVLRRCDIDVTFSEGFSPHMLMSFAMPLGVGTTSDGEYFDLQVNSAGNSEEMKRAMNDTSAEGFRILSIKMAKEEKADKCMTLVAASDYEASFSADLPENIDELLSRFMASDEAFIIKKTKHNEEKMNIRPFIYRLEKRPDNKLYMFLSAGSVNHVRPDHVMDALANVFPDVSFPDIKEIHRFDLYTKKGKGFIPLSETGEEF